MVVSKVEICSSKGTAAAVASLGKKLLVSRLCVPSLVLVCLVNGFELVLSSLSKLAI